MSETDLASGAKIPFFQRKIVFLICSNMALGIPLLAAVGNLRGWYMVVLLPIWIMTAFLQHCIDPESKFRVFRPSYFWAILLKTTAVLYCGTAIGLMVLSTTESPATSEWTKDRWDIYGLWGFVILSWILGLLAYMSGDAIQSVAKNMQKSENQTG